MNVKYDNSKMRRSNFEFEMSQVSEVCTELGLTEIPHANSRFKQQKMAACRTFLTPCYAAIIYAVFSVISLIIGLVYFFESDGILELVIPYPSDCGNVCSVSFTVDGERSGPFYVYYQLENFFQNNYLYESSKSWTQLTGGAYKSEKDLDSCSPMILADPENENYSGNILVPCGATPNSVFNDTFVFDDDFPEIIDTNISLKSFRDMFKDPDSIYDNDVNWLDPVMFPGGQTNERFINWIQIAPFSKFRKLWGKISSSDVLNGTYTMTIYNNYPVSSFDGTKSVIISQVKWSGGKNRFFGIFFLVICALSGAAAIVFAILYATHALPLYRRLAKGGTLEAHLIEP